MAKSQLDDGQIDGQMSIEDLFEPPARLFAVSRIFARARKEMSLAEQKTFVYALSELKFTEEATSNIVYMDKKTLAKIVGIESDPDHLSINLKRAIEHLPQHSFIKIADPDLDLFDSGVMVSRVTMLKNRVRLKFEEDYLRLFTGLSSNYITMWSADIFQMTSQRSVQFYEFLRQETDTREQVNSIGLGVKALKEMFDIPMDGPGSYMREKGGFDRNQFERRVILPLCADLQKTRMIRLIVRPDGMPFRKIKRGNRVLGYEFCWSYTAHPAVADAETVRHLQERVDKNPKVLKVAEDIVSGKPKPAKSFQNFDSSGVDYDAIALAIEMREQQEQERDES